MDRYNLVSFAGIFILLGIAWLVSCDRRNMNWRAIAWGVGLQLLFGLFIFLSPPGREFFVAINDFVVKLLDAASAGSRFLFGPLALPPGTTDEHGGTSLGFILAFQAFPTIVFFSENNVKVIGHQAVCRDVH